MISWIKFASGLQDLNVEHGSSKACRCQKPANLGEIGKEIIVSDLRHGKYALDLTNVCFVHRTSVDVDAAYKTMLDAFDEDPMQIYIRDTPV